MNPQQRRHISPEEKVAILRRHFVDKVPLSDLCDEYRIQPQQFYVWQKTFFENGAAAAPGCRTMSVTRSSISSSTGGRTTTIMKLPRRSARLS